MVENRCLERIEPYAYQMHATINPVEYSDWLATDYSTSSKSVISKGEWVIVVGGLLWSLGQLGTDTLIMHQGRLCVAIYLDLTKFKRE